VHLQVSSALCCGQGRCYAEAPGIFSPKLDGFVAEADEMLAVIPEHEEEARRAVISCPEQAIALFEA
jgi:ferredoxin